ncbi:MAG: alpha-2-macroglobulin, partial [Pseudomonadota bacterium]
VTQALERAESLFGFRVTDHTVDYNSASPRVCATFSEPLQKGGVAYGDYVQTGRSGLTAEATGQQLCISGLTHGDRHRIAFRAGLPSANGDVLAKSVEITVYVQDRDPTVRFAGRAYVLAPRPGASVPLLSVNVEKVDVKVYRIGDRNLVRTLREDMLAKPLSRWDLRYFTSEVAQEVWSGTAEVARSLNQEVTTALPVADVVTAGAPGVYALTARVPGDEDSDAVATQWFVLSDIGIATMEGNDGLHVFARSLRTAAPMAGAQVALVSRSNIVLGEAVTDAAGRASFPAAAAAGTGGAAPALVTVATGEDFAFLDQGAAEFDLSDRGVAGRAPAPPIDVFLATDRGAYRPGERVETTLLARAPGGAALAGVPLTIDLIRPDGIRAMRRLAGDVGSGGAVTGFDLPGNAARGTWKMRVLADRSAPPLLEERILVEDFVPEKIDFDLALAPETVTLGSRPTLNVDARYLFGAPGAGLVAEGDVRIVAAGELDAYPGYRFGSADVAFSPRTGGFGGQETGPDGRLSLPLDLPPVEEAAVPLTLEVVTRLRDGSGRPVERRISAPIEPAGPMIGIKPRFDGAVAEGAEAVFDVLAVGQGGSQVALGEAEWVINRVRTRYQWYQQYGQWTYDPITRREQVASGTITLGPDGTARIAAPVRWGRYEVTVTYRGVPYTQASRYFTAGWYATGGADDTPDLLDVGLDRGSYASGDQATLRIVSRFDGVAQVSVLADRLIETRAVAVTQGENAIAFDVTDAWGAGAYVTASVMAPMANAPGQAPARALGLAYAAVDPGARALAARFESPVDVSPRGPYEAVLHVEGLLPGETGHVTIAAVDVGVLNLTGFEPPAPKDHYFGQRRLGVELRDLYGRLISAEGAPGRLRSGGDGAARSGLQGPPPNEDVMALFSGPITVGPDGRARHRFDLPDFNGTVKLMAVVWYNTGVGEASQDVLVRDPVVLQAFAPRFLSPGDESRVRLELTHAFGPTGAFDLTLSASGDLALRGGGTRSVTLGAGERQVVELPVVAGGPGVPRFEAFLKTPDGKVLTKSIRLAVQWQDPEIARQTRLTLAPGDRLNLSPVLADGLHPGTVTVSLAAGPLARFDAPGLLLALDRYPYGCTEQVTSRALPLLYFDQISAALGLGAREKVAERINQSIARVLGNQASNGAFGLWRPASGDLWLDAYVTDFLSRARSQGYEVPTLAFDRALDNLRNRVNYAGDFEDGGEDVAYALYVLAREGKAAIGDLRYYADARADNFRTALAQAQLGAALAAYGDQRRADRMFRLAGVRVMTTPASNGFRADYGSTYRDRAAVLSLAVAAGSDAVDRAALANAIARAPAVRRSTQDNVWTLLAVRALLEDGAAEGLTLDGAPMAAPLVRAFDGSDLAQGVEVANTGGSPVTTVLNVYGVPNQPEPAGGTGYAISRDYYTMEGDPVDPATLDQNARLVTVLTVTPTRDRRARLMVSDPLPAGLEIDNPAILRSGDIRALDWLRTTELESAEFRSDRFLAAVDWRGREPFRLAYIVRAVSPGDFHHAAATVEDMYRPDFRARTATGRVTVE